MSLGNIAALFVGIVEIERVLLGWSDIKTVFIQGKYEQVKFLTVKCTIEKEAALPPLNLELFCYFLAFCELYFFFRAR